MQNMDKEANLLTKYISCKNVPDIVNDYIFCHCTITDFLFSYIHSQCPAREILHNDKETV